MKQIAILSDLHLPHEKSPDSDLFLAVLRKLKVDPKIEAVWLLGDIFDLLVGPFAFWKEVHEEIFDELQALATAKELLFVEGNHDFHWKSLACSIGIDYHVECCEKEFSGKKIFLAHGDQIILDEPAYVRWRGFIKNQTIRQVFQSIPPFILKQSVFRLARKYSAVRKKNAKKTSPLTQKSFQRYASEKQAQGFDAVFLGHSHIQESIEAAGKLYFNAGSWLGPQKPLILWEARNRPRIIEAQNYLSSL